MMMILTQAEHLRLQRAKLQRDAAYQRFEQTGSWDWFEVYTVFAEIVNAYC